MGDLRTQKTMRSLKNAFLELLEQYRFEDITVGKLCEKAEIRRATFYSHFSDKYEFLSYFIQEKRDEFLDRLEQPDIDCDKSTADTSYYKKLFHALILFFEEHSELVKNIKNSQVLPVIIEIFSNEVQQNVYHYLNLHDPSDPSLNQMKSHFYAGGILKLLMLWFCKPDEVKVDQIDWLDYLS